ncbi:proton channel OTOP1-like [Dendrobates tinctorius]|uniref:proton channel OTOP1-like n=1 Tax=Dendrobates tinctorius TaxID=92724 RepID=UPI003CC9AF05
MVTDMTEDNGYDTLNGISLNIMDIADEITLPPPPPPPPPIISDQHMRPKKSISSRKHKNSEVASSQYGINIFIIGLILMFATYLKIDGLAESDRLIFLIILMLIQVLWMIFYMAVGSRKRWATVEKDGHAGARWLRCGVGLFAVTTIAMHALKLGYFVGYIECMSIIEGIYPVTHIIHTVFQVYFLWRHSKDIVKSFKKLERFGLIHAVYTNLLLWVSAVATESDHQLEEHMGRLNSLGFVNITLKIDHPSCNCSTDLCENFRKGIYYIYPFNIEYQILASAMLYVLWKNIGNNLGHCHHRSKLNFRGVVPGTLLGATVLAATIAVVVIYLLNIGRSKIKSESALCIFYLYAIAVLSFMCIVSVIGIVIYKLDNIRTVKEKSPAVKLDESLLVGSATGSWITSWGSIIAIMFTSSHPTYIWCTLPYSILMILEKCLQNLFIVTYINRKDKKSAKIPHMEISALAADGSSSAASIEFRKGNEDKMQNLKDHNSHNATKQEGTSTHNKPPDSSPRFKKAILKNVTIALFLCNISLWIPPAFGCRPQYDNGLEAVVFGFTPWIIIVDIAVPFSIFYRMHSAYSLFDVYCKIGSF